MWQLISWRSTGLAGVSILGFQRKRVECDLSDQYRYDHFVVGMHDVICNPAGEWYFRGINVCTNEHGRKWLGPYGSEQAVSMAISHELLRGLRSRQQRNEFKRVA